MTNPINRPNPLPSQEYLLSIFEYFPDTGKLFWRCRTDKDAAWNGRHAGRPVGCIDSEGYIKTKLDGVCYRVPRLIWKMVTGNDPKGMIDHENRIKNDDRFSNLRDVTNQENQKNCKLRSINKSGINGVCFAKDTGKWQAQIDGDKGREYLGQYHSKEDAADARRAAEIKYGYHPTHGRSK